MKKTTISIFLIILISIPLTNVFTKPAFAASAVDLLSINNLLTVQTAQFESIGTGQGTSPSNLSCANPIPTHVPACQAMEQEILNSTVRLLLYTPLIHVEGFGMRIVNGMGHATIKDGRYLVTHNHYDDTIFSMLQQGDPDNMITIDIIDTNGEFIMQVPAQTISVIVVDKETLVFDFGETDGVDFFIAHDLPSAKFASQPSMPFQPGMEVAQIDWDGASTHIDWTTIEEVKSKEGTPIVKLSNCIKLGASGGGVFWQGFHLGNNWSKSSECGEENASESSLYSSVALNSGLWVTP